VVLKDIENVLSIDSLYKQVNTFFNTLKTPELCKISTGDCLMSGLAVFGLKFSSLLQFSKDMTHELRKQNLCRLFGITNIPSDTYMRERLDKIDPKVLNPAFAAMMDMVEQSKLLKQFEFLDGRYLIPIDGTQFFSSDAVHCDHCCTRKHKDGTVSYHHQSLGIVIVHPDQRYVLPLLPHEFICKKDGDTKNDCELNAVKRLTQDIAEAYPQHKFIVVEDALYANAPHVGHLESLNMQYIIVAKEKDHKYLFNAVKATRKYEKKHRTIVKDGITHYFEFTNDVPLNETHPDVRVNFLYYKQTDKKGRETVWTWVTNITLTMQNVYQIMRGGRARWRIENNAFNTLKNQGYNFEHNYGHGYEHLANTMATLMLLAFAIDQIQMLVNKAFQMAKESAGTYERLWQAMSCLVDYFFFENWEMLISKIAYKRELIQGSSP
jgi:hypothetical protein